MPPRQGEDASFAESSEGWEARWGAAFLYCAAISAPKCGARDGIHMKNTGKRIFFAVTAFLVVNAGVVVLAGALTSSR